MSVCAISIKALCIDIIGIISMGASLLKNFSCEERSLLVGRTLVLGSIS